VNVLLLAGKTNCHHQGAVLLARSAMTTPTTIGVIILLLSSSFLPRLRIRLTRHKISDGWRERAWLRVRGCSYHELGIGTASRSLHRLVRFSPSYRKTLLLSTIAEL